MGKAEMIFGVVAMLLAVGVIMAPLPSEEGRGSGLAAKQTREVQTDKPYIEMLSPTRNGEIFTPEQTFMFRPKNIDYEVSCHVLADEERVGDEVTLSPGQLGEVRKEVSYGYHTWSVECKLLNGRTIASQQWDFRIRPPEEMNQAFKQTNVQQEEQTSGNQVTGQVTAGESEWITPNLSVFLVLVVIGGLVWAINFSRAE